MGEQSDLTNRNILFILEARSQRSSCWQGHVPSEGTRTGSIPGLSPTFLNFLGLWQHKSNLPRWLYIYVQISLFYKDTGHIRLGTHLMWYDFTLTERITSIMTLFPNKITVLVTFVSL
jgi:hypothetical protein